MKPPQHIVGAPSGEKREIISVIRAMETERGTGHVSDFPAGGYACKAARLRTTATSSLGAIGLAT
jgi:hypothetical protein